MELYSHVHRTLDEKGRLVLPPAFRDQILDEVPEGKIVLTLHKGNIIGITPEQWAVSVKELKKIKNPGPAALQEMNGFFSHYAEVPVSKQGRIAIPSPLRASTNLGDDVSVLGLGARFEIWPMTKFIETFKTPVDASEEYEANGVTLPF